MRHSAKTLMGFTLLALALGLTACGAGENSTSSKASLTLRTYTVPEGRAQDLRRTLNQVLGMGDDKNQIGRTWNTGSGQILVLAPERMQASIAASIKQIIGKNSAATKPSQPLRLNAWVVDAYPGTGSSDPSLKTIQPALEAFSKATGPAHFVQVHYLMAVSDIGVQTKLQPLPRGGFFYQVNRDDGSLVLGFDYSGSYTSVFGNGTSATGSTGLQGQVTVQLGQTLVLGLISDRPIEQSGAHHQASKAASSAGAAGKDDAQSAGVVHRLLVVRITPATQN
ncbi:MAG: hypothetical protein ACRESG_03400 [Gammaproteobacteria bacterium]